MGLKERAPDISAREQGGKATGISASSAAWPFRGRVAEGKKLTGGVRLSAEAAGAGRWAGVRERGAERGAGCGPGDARAGKRGMLCWLRARAGRWFRGPSGPGWWTTLASEERAGLKWTGPRERKRAGLFWVWSMGPFSIFLSLFYFYSKQSLNSNQNLNSNHSQIIKTMNQHECNIKI